MTVLISLFKHFLNTASDTSVLVPSCNIRFQTTAPLYLMPVLPRSDLTQGMWKCAVCRTGVGRSSIRCSKCNLWVHYKKCSGLKTLSEDLSYECPRCRGVPGVRPVDGRPFKEVEVGDCVLEAVDRFCYLGDMLSAGGGCMAAATARCRCAWGKFRENLPLLTSKPVPFDLRGRLFSSNVRSSMLHGTETWPMTSAALHRLCRNDRAMIRWICGVKPSDDPSMDELHAKLGICDLAILVRERRLRWFGHVMRSNGEINRVRSRPVPGRKGPGRPKKTWDECVKQDLKVCGLSEAGTQDRLSYILTPGSIYRRYFDPGVDIS